MAPLAALALLLLCGCNPLGERNVARQLDASLSTLATSGHPSPRELATADGELSALIDPGECALDRAQQPLRSGSATPVPGGMQLASTANEMCWAIYAGALDGGVRPEQLVLEFQARSGVVWLGLADFSRGFWEWQELAPADSVQIEIDADLGLAAGGALFITLAVYDGCEATFRGGELRAAQPDEPTEAEGPEIVGAYLSMGYWDQQRVSETFSALGSAGVNFVIDYALTAPEDEFWTPAFEHYCACAAENGIGIGFWLASALTGMTPLEPADHLDQAVAMVTELKQYDAIGAWYVHDEVLPWISGEAGTMMYSISLAQMQQLYGMIHEADPSRAQISVWHTLPSFELFNLIYTEEYTPYGRPSWMDSEAAYEQALADMLQTTCDSVMIDMYPVGAPWLDGSVPAEQPVIGLTQRAAALKGADQPLVLVFQAFSWAQYNPDGCPNSPFPSRDELDRMLCGAHTFGADSAIAYSWFDLADGLPGRDIDGCDDALANLLNLFGELNTSGWPEVELAMGSAPDVHPTVPPKPPLE